MFVCFSVFTNASRYPQWRTQECQRTTFEELVLCLQTELCLPNLSSNALTSLAQKPILLYFVYLKFLYFYGFHACIYIISISLPTPISPIYPLTPYQINNLFSSY